MRATTTGKRSASPAPAELDALNTPPMHGCPVNEKLPPELLLYIVKIGMSMEADLWVEPERQHFAYGEGHSTGTVSTDVNGKRPLPPPTGNVVIEAPSTTLGDLPVEVYDGDEAWEDTSMSSISTDDEDDEDADDDDDGVDLDSEDEPRLPFQVLISHVCRRWRTLALSTPSLWTTFAIGDFPPFPQSCAYLERSADLPIDIYINCLIPSGWLPTDHPDHPEYSPRTLTKHYHPAGVECVQESTLPLFYSCKELGELLTLLTPHVERWRVFELSAAEYSYIHYALYELASIPAAPVLKTFRLQHYEECEDGALFSPPQYATLFLPFQGNAPALQQVSLWGVHIDWERSVGLLSNLKELELAYHAEDVRPSYATLKAILEGCPELFHLTLSQSGPRGDPADLDSWANESHISLRGLEELILCFQPVGYACALVRLLFMPRLRNLLLDFEEEDFSQLAYTLAEPTRCSRRGEGGEGKEEGGARRSILGQLESLKIAGLPCDEGGVEKMLEQLVALRALNLDCTVEGGEAFYARLVLGPSEASLASTSGTGGMDIGRPLCPLLQIVTVRGVEGAGVRELVEARIKAGVPLNTVLMSIEDGLERQDRYWLEAHLDALDFFEPTDDELTDDEDGDGDESDDDMYDLE